MRQKAAIFSVIGILVFSGLLFVFLGNGDKTVNGEEFVEGVSKNTILIGTSSALTGHAGLLGQETNRGAVAYIDKINEDGGINGRKIKLISYDDQYDPPQTVANTEKLIKEDKVFALFNYVGTPTSLAIMPLVSVYKIPLLGIFSGSEYLRIPVQREIFNLRGSYAMEAEAAVSYLVDKLNLSKIGVFYQEDSFGLSGLKGVEAALEKRNMSVSIYDSYKRGSEDVSVAVGSISKKNPEAVILVGTYTPLAKFIKEYEVVGENPDFIAMSFVGSEAFSDELIGVQGINRSLYDKIMVTQVVSSPKDEGTRAAEEYRELMNEKYPGEDYSYASLEGFLNAKILVLALNGTGKELTREKFIDYLESMRDIDYGGKGRLTFNSTNHQGMNYVHFSKLSDEGNFEEFIF